ncbi:hypothetical protein I302_101899 [Kwoniella bestiolae CBS 10118]|uniref:Uncharacterized protein n=1 Tax=Kwoniella bestiolae CBS 10118 TaxID=1296100 RepID=A0A1B9GDK1_9TREE|nr:hypothetical protein I302_00580 [Kwoniella bestiolae CBS 10118]OCF29088.1 hypothetical protein I302_00580 [Kwoniella bestiolae CBS 10118]
MTITTDRDWGREGIGTGISGAYGEMAMGIRLDNVDAGPSRTRTRPRRPRPSPSICLPSSEDDDGSMDPGMCECEICVQPSPDQRTRSRRFTTPISSFLPLFLLPFLPTTSAAPPPTRIRSRRLLPRSPSPTTTSNLISTSSSADPSTSSFDQQRHIQYLTSVSTPSVLPTQNTYVDETVLPYLLTRHEEGHWIRAEGGWSLYGRQVATATPGPIFADDDGEGTTGDAQPTVTAPSYAVESVLPNGWGVSSNRTSIYKVPLISIASVILATGIVALIVFIVLNRRKKHRKRKRAKERLRRKALAAAGIREEDLNHGNGGNTEVIFKEKLKELENQHLAKKKKNGQAGLAKNKVRVWNSRLGLRKRKNRNKGGEKTVDDDDDEVVEGRTSAEGGVGNVTEEEEDKPVEGVDAVQSTSPTSTLNRNEEEEDSRSIRSSIDSGRGADNGGDAVQPQISTAEEGSSMPGQSGINPQTSIPHFPPAYRPASIRSLPRHTPVINGPSSSSSSAGPSHALPHTTPADPPVVMHGTEKTQAPGYYPAPATEDGEIALAVVSRSEGKSRLVEPPVEEDEARDTEREERIRHVATDDKRVLERLRLGASAPPVNRSEPDGEREGDMGEGPSAPTVQVDEQGFEQLDESHLHIPSSPPTTAIETDGQGLLPAPPRLNARLSSRLNDIPSPRSPGEVDTSHLLPSAPPVMGRLGNDSNQDIPSAPPMLDDEEVNEVSTGPSAPSFDPDEEAISPTTSRSHTISMDHQTHQEQEEEETLADAPAPSRELVEEEEDEEGQRRDSEVDATFLNALPARSGSGSGPVFLPRYEP